MKTTQHNYLLCKQLSQVLHRVLLLIAHISYSAIGSCFKFWVRSRAAPVAELVAHSALSGRVTPAAQKKHIDRYAEIFFDQTHQLANIAVSDHRYFFRSLETPRFKIGLTDEISHRSFCSAVALKGASE
ncbi:hypothetical protein PROFUN_16867 [Planoprotostelium fungivorum]|uniref:Uncharacterized protein n=1 Tax=Planoprotostelium fungivorum TaxID=1890364 RepID=A0A2P6MNI9_9EUKA|nr:hypothetical protein PROFUN_16867 [Planoprotostelium fungivorum]